MIEGLPRSEKTNQNAGREELTKIAGRVTNADGIVADIAGKVAYVTDKAAGNVAKAAHATGKVNEIAQAAGKDSRLHPQNDSEIS